MGNGNDLKLSKEYYEFRILEKVKSGRYECLEYYRNKLLEWENKNINKDEGITKNKYLNAKEVKVLSDSNILKYENQKLELVYEKIIEACGKGLYEISVKEDELTYDDVKELMNRGFIVNKVIADDFISEDVLGRKVYNMRFEYKIFWN